MIKKFNIPFAILALIFFATTTLCSSALSAEIKTTTFERGLYRVTKQTQGQTVKKVTYAKRKPPLSFTNSQINDILSRTGGNWRKTSNYKWVNDFGYTAMNLSTVFTIDMTYRPSTVKAQARAIKPKPIKATSIQPTAADIQIQNLFPLKAEKQIKQAAETAGTAIIIVILAWLTGSLLAFALVITLIILLIKTLRSHNKRADKLTACAETITNATAERIKPPSIPATDDQSRYQHPDAQWMPKA